MTWERIDEPEEKYNTVCEDYKTRGFKVIECTDEWEDVRPFLG
jgi:hypothetical protein